MNKKKKILLAEHSGLVSELLYKLLTSYGYEIKFIKDGSSMIDIVLQFRPDLIILDYDLPPSGGLKISKFLKKDFVTSSIPIILLIEKRQIRKKLFEIEHGIDDYLLKPPDPIDLEVRMEMALRRTEHHVQTNSLTKLPGSREIEKVTNAKIQDRLIFSFLYFDVNNFKSFNDKYSYMKGDSVILQTAHIINNAIRSIGNSGDFVGHIGGDDFIVVTTPVKEEAIAMDVIKQFDRLMPFHYVIEDRDKGFVMARDRAHKIKKMPLMSISVAIVNNKAHWIQNAIQLSETIFEIKKHLKGLPGSNYLVNRRSINLGKPQRTGGLIVDKKAQKKILSHEIAAFKPIGQLLLDEKIINEKNLEEALNRHWLSGQRLGEVIINMGLIDVRDLQKVLEKFQQHR